MINSFKKLALLVNFTLVFFTVQAQNSNSPLEDMVNALKNDRVADMVKYFDAFVPITINNVQSLYSHNQAEVVLMDFFEKNNPRDFTVMENGSPDNTSKFVIGYFSTPAGVKYNVYILMRLKGSFMLQEIKLNKE
jgi:hypothetical protein